MTYERTITNFPKKTPLLNRVLAIIVAYFSVQKAYRSYLRARINEHSFGTIPYRATTHGIEYLLIKLPHGGWSFPKGHPNDGEAPKETARRETLEETGLNVGDLEGSMLVERYSWKRNGETGHKEVGYWLAKVEGEQTVTVQAEEVSEYSWLSAEKALKIIRKSSKELVKGLR